MGGLGEERLTESWYVPGVQQFRSAAARAAFAAPWPVMASQAAGGPPAAAPQGETGGAAEPDGGAAAATDVLLRSRGLDPLELIPALTAGRELGVHERTVSSWRLKKWLTGRKDEGDSRRWLYVRRDVYLAELRARETANGPGVVKRGRTLTSGRQAAAAAVPEESQI